MPENNKEVIKKEAKGGGNSNDTTHFLAQDKLTATAWLRKAQRTIVVW